MGEVAILKEVVVIQKKEQLHQINITVEELYVNFYYLKIKRIMDILIALIGLIIFSPLFLLIAVLIKIENPKGPILFTQIRVGKDEKTFKLYKFRSMVIDAEKKIEELIYLNEVSGAMFKIKKDPRVTKIGKFIRRTSIDELPQLWNVLIGEMSIVGPRPPLLREVEEYSIYDKQRLLVISGCTGLWQVSGRSELNFQQMVTLDLHYILHRSLWLDVKILMKTVWIFVVGKGAY